MRTNLPINQHEYPFPVGETLVSTTDLQGRILYCNAAFIEVSGYTRQELLGQPHNLIRHPHMPEEAFRDSVRRMAEKHVAPIAAEIDENDRFPTELVQLFGESDSIQLDTYFVYPEELKTVARVQVFRFRVVQHGLGLLGGSFNAVHKGGRGHLFGCLQRRTDLRVRGGGAQHHATGRALDAFHDLGTAPAREDRQQLVAVLLGIVVGCVTAVGMGKMQFDKVAKASWFDVATPFAFGVPTFDPLMVLTMSLVMIVVMIESTGMFLALSEITGRKLSRSDLSAGSVGLLADLAEHLGAFRSEHGGHEIPLRRRHRPGRIPTERERPRVSHAHGARLQSLTPLDETSRDQRREMVGHGVGGAEAERVRYLAQRGGLAVHLALPVMTAVLAVKLALAHRDWRARPPAVLPPRALPAARRASGPSRP